MEFTLAGEDRTPWYHRVKLLGEDAEKAADLLQVGGVLFVEGRLEYRAWEGEEGRQSTVEIRALHLEPVEGPHELITDNKGQPRLKGALNQALLLGNLTKDAELRYTPQAVPVARFRLAVNERLGNGERKTHFLEVQAWGELGEWAGYLGKGEQVLVFGRLVRDSWTTSSEPTSKRYATRVEAERILRLFRQRGEAPSPPLPQGEAWAGYETIPSPREEEFPEDLPL